MKLILLSLILSLFIYGCQNKELPSKYLSNISVVRETEENRSVQQINDTPETPEKTSTYTPPAPASQTRYHIIVGSFGASEKKRAEKLVENLKAQEYPAALISSSQRYRVSIESFSTEAEANAARDEYRKITDRQDIWVHKVN